MNIELKALKLKAFFLYLLSHRINKVLLVNNLQYALANRTAVVEAKDLADSKAILHIFRSVHVLMQFVIDVNHQVLVVELVFGMWKVKFDQLLHFFLGKIRSLPCFYTHLNPKNG